MIAKRINTTQTAFPLLQATPSIEPKLSIAENEQLIAQLHQQLSSKRTQAERADINSKIGFLTSVISDQVKDAKHTTMLFEQENNSHLVFAASTKGYYKLLGRSAIFYAEEYAGRLGKTYVNINPDTDFFDFSKEGVVSVRLTKHFISGLNALEIKLDQKLSTPNVQFYKLPKSYSQNEIGLLYKQANLKKQQINRILLPKNPIPILAGEIKELTRVVYNSCQKFPELARSTLGKEMFQLTIDASRTYSKLAREKSDAAQAFKTIYNDVTEIIDLANIAFNLRLAQDNAIFDIGTQCVKIQRLTNSEYKRLANGQN